MVGFSHEHVRVVMSKVKFVADKYSNYNSNQWPGYSLQPVQFDYIHQNKNDETDPADHGNFRVHCRKTTGDFGIQADSTFSNGCHSQGNMHLLGNDDNAYSCKHAMNYVAGKKRSETGQFKNTEKNLQASGDYHGRQEPLETGARVTITEGDDSMLNDNDHSRCRAMYGNMAAGQARYNDAPDDSRHDARNSRRRGTIAYRGTGNSDAQWQGD